MGTTWEHDENMVRTDPKNPPLPQKKPKRKKIPLPALLIICMKFLFPEQLVTILNLD
jgi:hypothetical protein